MEQLKKGLGLLLSIMILCMMSLNVFAAEGMQDGIEFILTTSKEDYSVEEEIETVVTVINNNDFSVENVSLDCVCLDGYSIKENPTTINAIGILESGVVKTINVTYVPVENEKDIVENMTDDITLENDSMTDEITLNQTKTDTLNELDSSITKTLPQTKDNYNAVLWIVILIAVCLILIIFAIKRQKGKNLFTLLLCLALAGETIYTSSIDVRANDDSNFKTITIFQEVKVGEENVKLVATLSYESFKEEILSVLDDENQNGMGYIVCSIHRLL